MKLIYSNLVIVKNRKWDRAYINVNHADLMQLGGKEREIKALVFDEDDLNKSPKELFKMFEEWTELNKKLKEAEDLLETLKNEELDKVLGCKVLNEQDAEQHNTKRNRQKGSRQVESPASVNINERTD